MSVSSVYSVSEIAKHNKEQDLWIVLHGNVYDVTPFVDEHPGGVDTLKDVAGGDGSQAFDSVGHSESAKAMLTKYLVGRLSDEDKKASISPKGPAGTQGSNLAIAFAVALLGIMAFLILKP